ncbi:hypothetical protein MPER_05970, partial [Moniliophthora perniciosa FA553]
MSTEDQQQAQLRTRKNYLNEDRPDSLIRRSWHAMTEVFSPFSSADAIPETEGDDQGYRPTVRDYHSISTLPSQVRVPKKIATPIKVEGKVWFANERTWIAWLNLSVLLGTLSLALFNASKDVIARRFAYIYAVISVGALIYGYMLYQKRITMIQRRDPGHFDDIVGPVI